MKKLNIEKLAKAVWSKRHIVRDDGIYSMSLAKASKEIGIKKSTLYRVECVASPDINTYYKICQWLGQPMEKYFTNPKTKKNDESNKDI